MGLRPGQDKSSVAAVGSRPAGRLRIMLPFSSVRRGSHSWLLTDRQPRFERGVRLVSASTRTAWPAGRESPRKKESEEYPRTLFLNPCDRGLSPPPEEARETLPSRRLALSPLVRLGASLSGSGRYPRTPLRGPPPPPPPPPPPTASRIYILDTGPRSPLVQVKKRRAGLGGLCHRANEWLPDEGPGRKDFLWGQWLRLTTRRSTPRACAPDD